MKQRVAARNLTTLAWRRTMLRWAVIAVFAARVFSDTLGAAVVVVALVTIAVAAGVSLQLSRQFAENAPDAAYSPVPRLAIIGLGTVLVGVAALAWLALR